MNLDTFFEKFDQFADAPNAVAKMRELVMNLAVQGKLIDRVISEGAGSKILKDAGVTEAPPEDVPCLPSHWSWARLGSITVRMDSGWSPACLSEPAETDEWGVLKTTSVQPLAYQEWQNKGLPDNLKPRPEHEVMEGDILFTRAGPMNRVGILCVARPTRQKLMISDKIIRFHLVSGIDPDFATLAMNAGYSSLIIESLKSGMAASQVNISQPKLRSIPLPLPPSSEQKRIVAKVDELMALCDRLEAQQQEREEQAAALARASLARFAEAPSPANLNLLFHKSYSIPPADLRKAILTLAVQGKLVSGCPLPPPNDELKVAKRKLSEKEGIRNRAEVVRLNRAEWGRPIPKHWELPNFDDLLVIVSGVTKGRSLIGRKTETVPYLRVANVQRGYLDLNVMKEIEVLPEDENRYRLETGDVLMTEGGDWDKVGRAAVWRSEIDRCIHQNHVYRIRSPRKELLLPEWVECYVNSPVGRSFFEAASKQTTNLASINMTQLRGCPLPLPPSEEQRRIVAKVDKLMSLVDQLQTQLAASRASAKNLLDALVAELISE